MNPALALLFNLPVIASILLVLSMTLIPALVLRDLIRRGEREGRKIEAIRDKVEKKNHAR